MTAVRNWTGRFWTLALAGVFSALVPAAAVAACADYGALAVAQQIENRELGCGFSGVRWHEDGAAHGGFCALVGEGAASGETAIREAKLATCRQTQGAGNDAVEPVEDEQETTCQRSEISEGKGATTQEARGNAQDGLGLVRAQMINAGLQQCLFYDLGCTGPNGDRTCYLSVNCCSN